MLSILFNILIFPGFLFVSVFGLFAEFVDRKIYARLQNRVGPPWFQPLADFIKLLGKEEVVPCAANPRMFKGAPLVSLTAVVSAFLYIPYAGKPSLFSFNGDIIMVFYFLTIPTLAFFIGGWYSRSLYSRLGSVRMVTQLFAYEVPLFMSILAPALLADTWSLQGVISFYALHPWFRMFNLVGFAIALVALLGKLEKAPFDIPDAETEIVAGVFTEYSGKLLALVRLTLNVEMVAGAALLATVFLPFGQGLSGFAAFAVFVLRILVVVGILSLLRTIVARMRIDQMISFCWQYLVPLAILQLLLNLVLKGVLVR